MPKSQHEASEPYTLAPWLALAAQWQQALEAWTAWWMRGFSPTATRAAPHHTHATRAPFDPKALAELTESFKPRIEQLWNAAHAAHRSGGAVEPVTAPPPGDRRFASSVWSQQPYFAWL